MNTITSLLGQNQPTEIRASDAARPQRMTNRGSAKGPQQPTARELKGYILGGLSVVALTGLAMNRIERATQVAKRAEQFEARVKRVYNELANQPTLVKVAAVALSSAVLLGVGYYLTSNLLYV